MATTESGTKRTKRGNGEGSISPYPHGGWRARLTINGKRVSVYGTTRREVERELTKLRSERDRGVAVAPDRLTVGAYLDRWLKDRVRPTVDAATTRSYTSIVRCHLKPVLGQYRLQQLRPEHVQTFIAEQIASGAAPSTIGLRLSVLRTALGQAVTFGTLSRNVAKLVSAPAPSKRDVPEVTYAEPRRVLAAVQGNRLEALFTLALALALRVGECCALKWADLDLDGRRVTVRRNLQWAKEAGFVLKEPKTDAGIRRLWLPPFAVTALRAHRVRQREERLRAGECWAAVGEYADLVFTNPLGQPLYQHHVQRQLDKATVAAGLPRLRPHDLRHGSASVLLTAGLPLAVVSKWLGHTDVGITVNIYGHIGDDTRREIADEMERLLGKERTG